MKLEKTAILVAKLVLICGSSIVHAAAAAPSTVIFNVSAPLTALAAAVDAKIPQSFNEGAHPADSSVRWDIRSRGPVAITIGADDKITLTKHYYGDLQKFGALHISECHLGNGPGVFDPKKNYVLLKVMITATPKLAADGGSWYVEAANSSATVSEDPGSDHKCAVLGVYNADGIIQKKLADLNITGTVNSILSANRVKIPLDQLWARANQPVAANVNLGAFGNALQLCTNANLTELGIGPLSSTGNNVTVPITLTISPSISLQTTACPAAAAVAPNVSIH